MFDSNWRFNDALAHRGDTEIRAKGRLRHRPDEHLTVNLKVLDSYVGRYQITRGPKVEIVRDGNRLQAKAQEGAGDALVPESETSFSVPKYDIWISFVRDSTGKVTGFVGYQDGEFEGKKLD
jgi:hypothetical protein